MAHRCRSQATGPVTCYANGKACAWVPLRGFTPPRDIHTPVWDRLLQINLGLYVVVGVVIPLFGAQQMDGELGRPDAAVGQLQAT